MLYLFTLTNLILSKNLITYYLLLIFGGIILLHFIKYLTSFRILNVLPSSYINLSSILKFYFSIHLSLSKFKIHSCFISMSHLNLHKKNNLPLLTDPVPSEKRWSIYSVPCCSCDLDNIGQTRRWLKCMMDDHHSNVGNEELYECNQMDTYKILASKSLCRSNGNSISHLIIT